MRHLPHRLAKPMFVVVLALVLTLVASVGFGQRSGGDDGRTAGAVPVPGAVPAPDALPAAAARGDLTSMITAMQRRLRDVPRDGRGWATLGLAYVEQARVTADASYYPKAEQALQRAAAIARRDELVLTAQAALSAARHDFSQALRLADAALDANPYSAGAHVVRSDALTELGRYDDALAAAQRADELKPGVATFARISYARELRGDVRAAQELMQRAAEAASSPSDRAFAYYELGQLQYGQGQYDAAAKSHDTALRALPQDVASRAGKARVAAAKGDTGQAIAAYRDVVERLPLPEYLIELGELYEASGRPSEARAQYDVVRAGSALAEANGVNVDLETALFEADHGDPAAAVAAAKAEWKKRRSIAVADAMAWALHSAGRDREALPFARRATSLGTKDARLLYHRGMIESGVGLRAEARKSLRSALKINPKFSPLHAARARSELARLDAAQADSR